MATTRTIIDFFTIFLLFIKPILQALNQRTCLPIRCHIALQGIAQLNVKWLLLMLKDGRR
jgi:hypothetical protein